MPGRTVSRRRVVGLLGGGVALAPAIARAFSMKAPSTLPAGDVSLAAACDADALVAPLRPGGALHGFTIAEIGPVNEGAITVALESAEGHRFHLEILARDPSPIAPQPPAQTSRFAVYVRNGGDGWAPTLEEQGLAAMALSAIIKTNEGSADTSGLLTHAERLTRHHASLIPAAQSAK